ncbi:MAG: T9SS type A sorting domain-containing protein [Bacteroidia bacterium]
MVALLKNSTLLVLYVLILCSVVVAQFDPAAGKPGSKAIFKDSSIITGWAQSCTINRGPINSSGINMPKASHGEAKDALYRADGSVVSLGDSGEAVIAINGFIRNNEGPEFAIFENSFDDRFLELAFVEVSSNGIDFVRFPAVSLTDTTKQIGPFDYIEPKNLYNFAGKYRADYGVPFDLEELKDTLNLNIDSITYIKIKDVIGNVNLNKPHSRDSKGILVNDPFPTQFESGGFDLDALAFTTKVFNSVGFSNLENFEISLQHSHLMVTGKGEYQVTVYDLNGKELLNQGISNQGKIYCELIQSSLFIVFVKDQNGNHQTFKFVKNNN